MAVDGAGRSDVKVAVLINFLPPYHIPLLSLLHGRVRDLRVFISTRMEANRSWSVESGGLVVTLQRSLTLARTWRHPSGFSETAYTHFPLDTIPLLLRYAPDVIITTELGARSLGAILYKVLRPRTRVLLWLNLSERTEQGRGRGRSILRKWMLRKGNAVLVDGASGSRYLRTLGLREEALHVLPYPTDGDMFGRVPLERQPPMDRRLLYVGQLVPRKGLLPFIETLSSWAAIHPRRKVAFTLVGEGALHRTLESLRLPPNLRMTLAGKAGYRELPRHYAANGILAFPTLADEWGIVVNEAMASGLPVLGSRHSQAVQEMVEEARTGWLFDPESPSEMYEALDKALSTPIRVLSRMRRDCRAGALRFTPDRLLERLMYAIQGSEPR